MYRSINHLKIRYEILGDGKPLILLHGWRGKIESLHNLAMALSKKFKVYNFDLPGFGLSDEPKEVWGVEEFADFLKNFIEEFKLSKPILVGHSFGGSIAMKYELKYDKVKSLILIDSAGIRKPSGKVKFLTKISTLGKRLFSTPLLSSFKERARYTFYSLLREKDYYSVSSHMRKVMSKVLSEDMSAFFEKIKSDTYIIWGEKDRDTPVEHAKIMHGDIKGSKLEIIKDYAHGLPIFAPDLVAKLIISHFYRWVD
jgi:pimeloyl-ACP methyl ester carboxylesterase